MKPTRRHPLFGFRRSIGRAQYAGVAIGSILLTVGLWFGVTSAGHFSADFLPGPGRVLVAARSMFLGEGFAVDLLASAGRIAAAFAVSALLAIPLGLLMSSYKVAEAAIEPLVDFIRYVPVPALLPVFVLFTGIGETAKFLVLFFGTFFQLVLLVMDDADNVPHIHFDLARTMGASNAALMRDVLVPSMLPQLYDRLRVTLGWCWTYLVIAELVAVQTGVGHAIKEAQRFNAADRLFVACIALGLIGLLTDYGAKLGYRALFPYATKTSLQVS